MPVDNKGVAVEAQRAIMMEPTGGQQMSLLAHLISGQYEEDKMRKLQSGVEQGAPCKNCGDKCVGGLQLHFWRKICKTCKCKMGDHQVELSEKAQRLLVQNLFTASDGSSTLNESGTTGSQQQQGALPVGANNENGGNIQNQGYASLDRSRSHSDQERAHAARQEAEHLADAMRRQKLMKQFPPHDSDPAYCHDLSDAEKEAMHTFSDNVKRNVIGKGVVKQNTDDFPWTCSGCHGSIPPRAPAIFADRAGPTERWHPGCFKCSVCEEQLVDYIYLYEDGKLFCGRHYAEKLKARCAACDELIFEAHYTEAEDRAWHRRHFVCFTCESNLAGQQYVSHKSQPYCMQCYHRQHANTCSACHTVIIATSPRITHENRHWHSTPECFACRSCSKSLVDSQYMIGPDGSIYCSSDCARNAAS